VTVDCLVPEERAHGVAAVLSAFPFHFVLDEHGCIVSCGSALPKVCPGYRPGASAAALLTPVRHELSFAFEAVDATAGGLVILQTSAGCVLRGQFVEHAPKLRAFLGSACLETAEHLVALGLGIDDFAPWDAQLDLLTVLQSHRSSMDDLKRVNERLTRQGRELRLATTRAEDAARAKTTFLATMSHELRTPMNGVLGMAELLFDTPLDESQRSSVETIVRSSTTLLGLLNDILDVTKLEAGMMELAPRDFDLLDAVDDVLRVLGPAATKKSLALSLTVQGGVPRRIVADDGRYRQVLLNLVGNAVKFTPSGGVSVSVNVERDAGEGIVIRTCVVDTGPGIPEERAAALFQRFVQADSSISRRYGGTGLGLAIARELSTLLGGEVGFESKPGQGSTFWFTIRAKASDAARVPTSPVRAFAPKAERVGAGLRVLVADDDLVNQLVAQRMLARLGCDVVVVGDGSLAVERTNEEAFDVVFMDVMMPNMDGITATRTIRSREVREGKSPVRIVAMTASAMHEDQKACRDAGCDDYVAKPVTIAQLTACVARCLTAVDERRHPERATQASIAATLPSGVGHATAPAPRESPQ